MGSKQAISKYDLVSCAECGALIAFIFAWSGLDQEGHPIYLCDDCDKSNKNRDERGHRSDNKSWRW